MVKVLMAESFAYFGLFCIFQKDCGNPEIAHSYQD